MPATRRAKRLPCWTCALLLSPLLAERASYADTVLAVARKQFEVVPDPSAQGTKTELKITVKLIRVIPIRGNNPVNTVEPINNRNGKIVNPDATEPAATQTTMTASYKTRVIGGGTEVGEVYLRLDADGTGSLHSGQPAGGDAVIFELYVDGAATDLLASPSSANLRVVGGVPSLVLPEDGLRHSLDVRHVPTGRVFRVSYQAAMNLNGKVTVYSITRVV